MLMKRVHPEKKISWKEQKMRVEKDDEKAFVQEDCVWVIQDYLLNMIQE